MHPELELKDFQAWYKSALDEWETASGMLADVEREPESDNAREKLINQARRLKAEEEFQRADSLATVACSLKMLVDTARHGEFTLSIPDAEIQVEYKW